MPTVIDAFLVSLGLDSTEFKAGAQDSKNEMRELQEEAAKLAEKSAQKQKEFQSDVKASADAVASFTAKSAQEAALAAAKLHELHQVASQPGAGKAAQAAVKSAAAAEKARAAESVIALKKLQSEASAAQIKLTDFQMAIKREADEVAAKMKMVQQEAHETAEKLHEQGEKGAEFFDTLKEHAVEFFGIMASVGAFVAFTEHMIKSQTEMNHLSEETKASVEDISLWQNAVITAGGTADGFNQSLKGMGESLVAIEKGLPRANRAIKAFEAAGIKGLGKGKHVETMDMYAQIHDKLQNLSMAEAMTLGKRMQLDEATIRVLHKKGEAYEEFMDEAKKMGIVHKEEAEAAEHTEEGMNRLKGSMERATAHIAHSLLPVIDFLSSALTKLANWANEHPEKIKTGLMLIGAAMAVFSANIIRAGYAMVASWWRAGLAALESAAKQSLAWAGAAVRAVVAADMQVVASARKIAAWVAEGNVSTASVKKQIAAWAAAAAAAAKSAVAQIDKLGLVAAKWIITGVQATGSALKVVAAWVASSAGAVRGAAVQVAQSWRAAAAWVAQGNLSWRSALQVVASWAVAGAGALASGAAFLVAGVMAAAAWVMASGGLALLIPLIVALVYGIVKAYQHFAGLRAVVAQVFGFIKSLVGGVIEFFVNIFSHGFSAISAIFSMFTDVFSGDMAGLKKDWQKLWNACVDVLNDIYVLILGVVMRTTWAIEDAFSAMWHGVKSSLEFIPAWFKELGPRLDAAVGGWFNSLLDVWQEGIDQIIAVLFSMWESLKASFHTALEFLTNLWHGYINSWKAFFHTILTTATAVWNGVKNAAAAPLQWIEDKLKAVAGVIGKVMGLFSKTAVTATIAVAAQLPAPSATTKPPVPITSTEHPHHPANRATHAVKQPTEAVNSEAAKKAEIDAKIAILVERLMAKDSADNRSAHAANLSSATRAQAATVQRTATVNNNGRETRIGKIEVVTRATDAEGIARDIGGAVKSHSLVDHADGGMV